ncbi:MAG: phosphomannomutase/phosphoglucomutase, partial [Candidatus Bathyarchaeia archaeon]
VGRLRREEILDDYADHLVERVRLSRSMKAVVDVGNGVTGFSEEIFTRIGCKVKMLFKDPDGRFPNHTPDPVQESTLDALKKTVLEEQADLGVAFDGDGDRVGFVDDKGRVVKADTILILLSRDLLKRHSGAKVVATPLSSRALFEDVRANGGEIVLSKVGHSYVQEKLLSEDALLAGELSGHFYLREGYYGYDDAVYAALKVTEILSSSGESFSQIVDSTHSYISSGELRVHCADEKKFQVVDDLKRFFQSSGYDVMTIDGVRVEFEKGWGIVRASNTEPALVFRFEAEDEESYGEIKRTIEAEVEKRL